MIPLIDLKAQYESIKEEVDRAVREVLESGRYILGPNVEALEREIASYCGVKYGVGVASGTDALLLSLLALGIGPGDEVITTPFTFFATAEVIMQAGAKPVFVDIDPRTYNIDVERIEEKINENTKAIIPVHIFGQMVDMERVMQIARKYGLAVIEDACQAIGAEFKGQKAGAWGDAGCFSFFPTKNLGGYGDGGIVVTNDSAIAEKIRLLRAHGSKVKYYHSVIGYNSRLDEIQAAILRVKLKYIDEWNEKRRKKASVYNELLKGMEGVCTPVEDYRGKAVYHLYVIRAEKRERIREALAGEGISTGVYYPLPLHLQEALRDLGYKVGDFPEAEKASKETLALPLYPELPEQDIERIAEAVKRALIS